MKDYKPRLRALLIQPRWKILLFTIVLNGLLLWQSAIDHWYYLNFNFLFARRAFFKRTAQRAHWIGSQVAKPHRMAFLTLAAVLVAGVVIAPHTYAVLYWATGWGATFSIFVIYRSISLILQRTISQPRHNQQY